MPKLFLVNIFKVLVHINLHMQMQTDLQRTHFPLTKSIPKNPRTGKVSLKSQCHGGEMISPLDYRHHHQIKGKSLD